MPIHKPVANRPYRAVLVNLTVELDIKNFATWEAALRQARIWKRKHPRDSVDITHPEGLDELQEQELEKCNAEIHPTRER